MFYIEPRAHPDHLNEFYIVYYDSEHKKHVDPFKPYYLQRSATTLDNVSGSSKPLKFGYYSHDRDTPLALYKPEDGGLPAAPSRNRHHHGCSVALSTWLTEPVSCVIQHARQKSFIIAIAEPNGEPQQPQTTQGLEEPQEQQESQESQQVPQEEQQEPQEAQQSESVGHSVHQVSWMKSDTTSRTIKSFEIVPTGWRN